MESEYLEPLNLVIKKDNNDSSVLLEENIVSRMQIIEKDKRDKTEDSKINGDMSLLQEAIKSDDSSSNNAEQKILTAFYISSLMQMSNMSIPRNISPQSLNAQHNFVQLLAMVEARRRLWQQINWSIPPNILRNPLSVPHPYFDGPITNLSEQLSNIQNSLPAYTLSSIKQESVNHEAKQTYSKRSTIEQKNTSSLSTDNSKTQDTGQQNNPDKKKPHIKKPLNAFMLYMKEMRAKVVAECTLKESAAINQILGRRWHALGREEQAKYYELARRERQLHMQLYPDWSSRANTNRTKKRKRKQDTNSDPGGNNMKKCRARYGLDQQSQWCKPCSPLEHGAGMGIHASIIHHGVGSSVGAGVGAGGGGGTVAAAAAPSNTNAASNASSPQQEPTYVNL